MWTNPTNRLIDKSFLVIMESPSVRRRCLRFLFPHNSPSNLAVESQRYVRKRFQEHVVVGAVRLPLVCFLDGIVSVVV